MFFFLPVLLVIAAVLLPLFALIDILRNEFTGYNKIIWVIVVIFFPYLGSILYFILGNETKL